MKKRFIGAGVVLAAAIAIPTIALTQSGPDSRGTRQAANVPLKPTGTLAQTHTSIEDARAPHSTTLSGTITRISGDDFILDDGTGKIWVEAELRPLRRANLTEGETVSVTGYLDENELEAYRITRANGETIDILDD
ncbi:NirD/YgiW/YdeI family stress tolerance protein [Lyngbya confervoides]|uniref:NirD/YgiW/YdeI family stress tolerance protein n=1 Tax=Lyngbya confervoides BDU141951 TaxID=1574623 RepID=A0ABD4T529_9CYAN|nr:NirD/YgiW/YdeI family stress tolerance protein [Lyngbya confervoides]MCM1983901.1 NirD/YgiW/YdeI family stress tolerance protein [Lyngbya confervoides BDU141951]